MVVIVFSFVVVSVILIGKSSVPSVAGEDSTNFTFAAPELVVRTVLRAVSGAFIRPCHDGDAAL
jgi:hypothetical protein